MPAHIHLCIHAHLYRNDDKRLHAKYTCVRRVCLESLRCRKQESKQELPAAAGETVRGYQRRRVPLAHRGGGALWAQPFEVSPLTLAGSRSERGGSSKKTLLLPRLRSAPGPGSRAVAARPPTSLVSRAVCWPGDRSRSQGAPRSDVFPLKPSRPPASGAGLRAPFLPPVPRSTGPRSKANSALCLPGVGPVSKTHGDVRYS